ncbi:MAG: hypothetical protein OXI56_00035 [bacterium]|nr:hypothetical protein [bacterium]MDE0600165.1 hypothetical protein [bacterium]
MWEATEPAWAETAAVETAERIYWAHWTQKADPYEQFPFPVWLDGELITITPEMVDWVLNEVCSQ